MNRAEFVKGYMTRSELLPYSLEGEVVTYMVGAEPWILHALECHCGEDDCAGWAMITDGCQNWHKFQNGLTDMTWKQAAAADNAIRVASKARHSA